ncbi:N-acetylated-alpha-linked acidic dipeptidase 2 isoform X2 [Octopus sinensis]|uniref:N-acetylated-alpha-linked acidic dipeptidase 2 isoform X2 n=1 Tax=Octopus sinensis TaxID=2607531 RepID=A0A6P7SV71_9MOLL|nr:N-acetylated-alpha-linked acidic dipeptidase 2 isoform X2 [Octopus sinensis]XP_029642133.1 N-acetylated-alpha-linked acidic dipeptidase 2 isoform X2 [Octopus sinensis]
MEAFTVRMPSGGYIAGKALTRWEADTDNIDIDYRSLEGDNRCKWLNECFSGRKGLVLRILLVFVLFCVGLIVGYIIRRNVHEHFIAPATKCEPQTPQGYWDGIREKILAELDRPRNYEQHLRDITSKIFLSGVGGTNRLILYVRSIWKFEVPGMNAVHLKKYNVQLSYPNWAEPNQVFIQDGNNTYFQSHFNWSNEHVEYAPFNGYAPAGTVKGHLLYANYGEKSDFEKLQNVNGSIVIMRYGRVHPGSKVKHAENFGAIGAILYGDPFDYASKQSSVYPSSWWLPPWAVKISHVRYTLSGDPQTPDYAALDHIHEIPDFSKSYPKIPVHSVSYSDAEELMRDLTGNNLGAHWLGGLNISYSTGPGYSEPRNNRIVNLTVNNQRSRRDISNIIGVIRGKYEKDKYIIVGAHVDSWTQGAVDSGSGYAILMELVKSFSNVMKKEDWRPRRTIIFALWDATKYGHIGAYEWVQEYNKQLSSGAVAYINLDAVIRGNHTFFAAASPLLVGLIRNATKTVACPCSDSSSKRTVFDTWLDNFPNADKSQPNVSQLHGDGDHSPFLYQLGIPSLAPAYMYNQNVYPYLPTYPAYNTLVDTFDYLRNFIDRDLTLHMTVAKVVAEVILRLSDSLILPLDVNNYVWHALSVGREMLGRFNTTYEEAGISLNILYQAMDNFSRAADDFFQIYRNLPEKNLSECEIHIINHQLIRLSRAFIVDRGLPGQPHYKNVLMAPHPDNINEQLIFPGVISAALEGQSSKDYNLLKEQLAVLVLAFQTAEDVLSDGLIGRDEW